MEGALYSRQWEEKNEIIVTRIYFPPHLCPSLLKSSLFCGGGNVNRKDNLVSYCKKFSLVLSELLAHEGLDVVKKS